MNNALFYKNVYPDELVWKKEEEFDSHGKCIGTDFLIFISYECVRDFFV